MTFVTSLTAYFFKTSVPSDSVHRVVDVASSAVTSFTAYFAEHPLWWQLPAPAHHSIKCPARSLETPFTACFFCSVLPALWDVRQEPQTPQTVCESLGAEPVSTAQPSGL